MTRLITGVLAGIALGATSAYAVTWDTNDDGKVDAVEFATGNTAASTFERFDDNGDGVITPEEVGLNEPDAVFEMADNNNDGHLTQSELTKGTFSTYDRNQDGALDEDEMMEYEYDESIRSNPFAGESGRPMR